MKIINSLLYRIKSKISPIKFARELGVKVGDHVEFIAFPDFDTEPYLITIGNHVKLASKITFVTHDGGTYVFRQEEQYKKVFKYGKIIIHDNCFKNVTCTWCLRMPCFSRIGHDNVAILDFQKPFL